MKDGDILLWLEHNYGGLEKERFYTFREILDEIDRLDDELNTALGQLDEIRIREELGQDPDEFAEI